MKRKHLIWLLVALGIVFLVIGVSHGEGLFVFTRGTNICLECIGIG